MAKDDIIIRTELLIAKSKTNIKKLKAEMDGLDMRFTESKLKVAELANEELKLAKAKQILAQRNKELSLSENKLSKSTGAATSAALELGRVISDAPYGIRGVANNVSQLASQFSFMANSVDAATGKVVGFKGALKSFGAAIKANAVLLLIQGVVAALDHFAGGAKKAEKNLKSLVGEIDKLLSKLSDLEGKLPDALAGLFERLGLSNDEFSEFASNMKETLKILNNEFPEFKKAYDNLSSTQKKDPKVISDIIVKYRELLDTRKQIKIQEETLNKIRNKTGKYAESNLKRVRGIYKNLILRKIELEKIFTVSKKIAKENKKEKSKVSFIKTGKELEIDIKNNEKELLKYNQSIENQLLKNAEKMELLNAKTEEEKTAIKRRYAEKALDVQLKFEKKQLILRRETEMAMVKLKAKNHRDELKRITNEYKLKVDLNDKLTDSQKNTAKSDADSKLANSLLQSEKEEKISYQEIGDKYEPIFRLFEDLKILRKSSLGIFRDGEEKEKEMTTLSEYIEAYKTLMSGVTDFVNGEFDRQMTIEQNKTNMMNEQLNNRLLNEKLSAEQRKNIQQQIWQNDEKLRKKQEEIAKKKFKVQKAFNISMAVADTYLAGVKVLADPAFVGRPWTRGIAMAATIAGGLASVAAIARQKFQSTSAATPINTATAGGGSGGVGNRTFDFNLVGNTQQNQLAEAIQGNFDKPVRAYVVSKDITNQQQLDANIKGTATL